MAWRKIIFVVLIISGAGAALSAVATDNDFFIALKQQLSPPKTSDDRLADRIGIVPPNFEGQELEEMQTLYEERWGEDHVRSELYRGYTLLIPDQKKDDVRDARKEVDELIIVASANIPTPEQQETDRGVIQRIFQTEGEILYDQLLGAYTDEQGYQYNFYDGEIVSKQIGVSGGLRNLWEQGHPKQSSSTEALQSIGDENQIIDEAFSILQRAFPAVTIQRSEIDVTLSTTQARVTYHGLSTVRMLFDRMTKELFHYNLDR